MSERKGGGVSPDKIDVYMKTTYVYLPSYVYLPTYLPVAGASITGPETKIRKFTPALRKALATGSRSKSSFLICSSVRVNVAIKNLMLCGCGWVGR